MLLFQCLIDDAFEFGGVYFFAGLAHGGGCGGARSFLFAEIHVAGIIAAQSVKRNLRPRWGRLARSLGRGLGSRAGISLGGARLAAATAGACAKAPRSLTGP